MNCNRRVVQNRVFLPGTVKSTDVSHVWMKVYKKASALLLFFGELVHSFCQRYPKVNFGFVLASITYLLINGLFVVKYSTRLMGLGAYLILFVYLAFLVFFGVLYAKIRMDHYYKPLFLFLTLFFFGFTIYLNITVDGNSLNVDRWSAMEVGIKAFLNGEYPYSAVDHLGGRTSNLPTLIFLGIPFYFLGGVGFLQSFCFLVFAYVVFILFDNYKERLFCLILLIFSPSYLWELYAKSDLMSNLILILLFLSIVHPRFLKGKDGGIWFLVLISFIGTSLVLTRLVAIIPISLLMVKRFFSYSIREKVVFSLVSLFTAALFLYLGFRKVESIEHLLNHNPFNLQNSQLPVVVSFLMVCLPVVYSFFIKNLESLIKSTVFFLIFPILIAFSIIVSDNGIYSSVVDSAYDISYFNIVMPFLLIAITLEYFSVQGEKKYCSRLPL